MYGSLRMRVIHPIEHRPSRWKNGGGVTHEIVVEPPGESAFVYRVSVAEVETDGPFSRFAGYDRHIMVIDGAGMTLDAGAHGRLELAPGAPVTFSGDWDVTGSLRAGPVRDFNLIVDRARAGSWLRVRDVADTTVFGFRGTAILYVLTGALHEATQGDTIVARDEEVTVHGRATLAIANIVAR
jgi:uncharacterized protein